MTVTSDLYLVLPFVKPARDNLHFTPAALTGVELDTEHALESELTL